jgi:hypothetical protein
MIDQAHQVSDPTAAVNNCVGAGIGELDNYTSAQRQAYETAFAGCQKLMSCDFETCFHP